MIVTEVPAEVQTIIDRTVLEEAEDGVLCIEGDQGQDLPVEGHDLLHGLAHPDLVHDLAHAQGPLDIEGTTEGFTVTMVMLTKTRDQIHLATKMAKVGRGAEVEVEGVVVEKMMTKNPKSEPTVMILCH